MPILLAAIIETLIYLAAIPVSGAFVLSTANGLRYGVGVGVFGLQGALRALGAGRAVVDVTPVFDGDGLCLELQGMIRLRSGQIMWAMAMSQLENIRRRIARWTDTRLKA
ncbi:MAG: hypothetical protein IJH25_06795 [Clostridia bacterium]|nr:hypothetical protein [Clostridia bacterium]